MGKSWSKVRPETQKKPKKTALYRGGHRIKESRGNTAVIRRDRKAGIGEVGYIG